MTRHVCLSVVVSASVLAACAGPAQGQVVTRVGQSATKGGQDTRTHDTVVKRRYSRGVKEGAAPAGAPAATPAATLHWEPVIGMDAQLFPSFIVSTATMRLPQEEDAEEDPRQLGEALGFIGVSLEGVPAGATIRVETKPNAAMDTSVFEGRATAGAGDYQVNPKINFRYDALLDWHQPMPLNIVMEVAVNGRSLGTQSTTVAVRSINDCPFVIVADEESDEEDLDMSWMFAAYVNENHPFVNTLTREALESRIIEAFDAYQEDSPENVLAQVYAIWHVLQKRGMRYSDISQASAESEVVFSQHVRLLDESLAARQANCVDGTALMAAVLRKIGIEPYLVLVPGHMFLAFDLDESGDTTLGLETTMMGTPGTTESGRSRNVPAALAKRFQAQPSFRSFVAAIDEGTSQLKKYADEFEGDDADYQLISVSEARQLGILPLAYRKPGGPARRP